MRRTWTWLLMLVGIVAFLAPAAAEHALAGPGQKVYVLHVDGFESIGPGTVRITQRIIQAAEAEPAGTAVVAIVLDTPGGLLESALEMKDLILGARIPTIAFVEGSALSAGALVATSAEKLYMKPGTVIGAAEPRVVGSGERADNKTVSAVVAAFAAAAQARGRDPAVAQAMVDTETRIPKQRTELLTLTQQEAVDLRYANGTAKDLADALEQSGLVGPGYALVDPPLTFSNRAGRFLTEPWVATLLLVVGVAAIGIELFKPGVAVPGVIGVICLSLFFVGNVLVGTAGWVEFALVLIGSLLLAIEAFIPGFGIFGIGGMIAVGASIFMAVPTTGLAVQYLMAVALASIVVVVGLVRYIGQRGLGKSLTLTGSASGWVPPKADLSGLVGQQGQSVTVLRPAGTAVFGDRRLDVVTEGQYVEVGTPVVVMRVEGTRVLVRPLER